MGCCQGSVDPAAAKIDNDLSKQLKEDERKDDDVVKVLLLGSGSSGKSTMLKQMKIMHGGGFSSQELAHYREVCLRNIVELIQHACKLAQSVEMKFESPQATEAAQVLMNARVYEDGMAPQVELVIADPMMKRLLEEHSLDILDSAPYYLEHLDRMLQPDFVPTNMDVLRCRAATTGIVQVDFDIKGQKLALFDVGGQKNERKKWIHCFDKVTALLYIANLNEYNQMCDEDTTRNRLDDSLALFDAIVNLPFFEKTSVILFLNKNDLFENKILQVDLGQYQPDYTGGHDYDAALEYITAQYIKRFKATEKQLYFWVTTATDTQNIEKIWAAVCNIIIVKNLKSIGLHVE